MEKKTEKTKLEKLNLPKSLKRHIREKKASIRKNILEEKEREKSISDLYKKVLKIKKPAK
ncbi:MAG: hypothetical protein WCX23_00910 [Candidatus Paceibacterota bacterium]|jgi:hypothetical protein|nr:hypothetical protein [Candidatus Paceibacterota bacterium]MDD4830611.1 hypothetical protein [Candidatus Paceibacterota bacterium]MDD4874932.1 hypothetical protein [Candidatus Paceibacterota bacterium]